MKRMLRRLQAVLMLVAGVVAFPAAAQELEAETAVEASLADSGQAAPATTEIQPPRGWDTFVSGYFRAPLAIGISPRRSPDDPDGPTRTQLSYGPNRTVDANYFSFAYTRLSEQGWAE